MNKKIFSLDKVITACLSVGVLKFPLFTPQEIFLLFISVRRSVDPGSRKDCINDEIQ